MSCPDCFTGTVHIGTPTGTVTTIHGLPCYVSAPPNGVTPKGIVVILCDAFGWEFPNNRLLSDEYAANGGFLVYVPDLMNGSYLPISFIDLMENKIKKSSSWFTTLFYKPLYIFKAISILIPFLFNNRAAVYKPRTFNFFTALRTSPPPFPTSNLKIGAAGFCWGGKYTVLLAQNAPSSRVQTTNGLQPLIDCGFTAHPSMVTMPTDIENVDLPLSVAVGNEDLQMAGPQILQMKEILEVKKRGDHEVVIMPGARHGFAVRMDPEDELQNKWAKKASAQAIAWFTKWFV